MFFRVLVDLTCECFCWTLGCKGYLSNKCRGSVITTHWTREYPLPQPRNSRGFTRPEPVSSQPGFYVYPPLAFSFFYDFSTSVTLIFSLHWYIHRANAGRALLSGGALQSLPVPLLQFSKRKKDRWFFFSSDQRKKENSSWCYVSPTPNHSVKPAFPLKCLLCVLAHTVALCEYFSTKYLWLWQGGLYH